MPEHVARAMAGAVPVGGHLNQPIGLELGEGMHDAVDRLASDEDWLTVPRGAWRPD